MPFVSELLGCRVHDHAGNALGRIRDVEVEITEGFEPRVVAIDMGWHDDTMRIGIGGFESLLPTPKLHRAWSRWRLGRDTRSVLLRRQLLDRQVIDLRRCRLRRANDVDVEEVDGAWRLVGIDFGATGLLRRLIPQWLDRAAAPHASSGHLPEIAAWSEVDPVESAIPHSQSPAAHAGLRGLPPATIAELMPKLGHTDRMAILDALGDQAVAVLALCPPPLRRSLLVAREREHSHVGM